MATVFNHFSPGLYLLFFYDASNICIFNEIRNFGILKLTFVNLSFCVTISCCKQCIKFYLLKASSIVAVFSILLVYFAFFNAIWSLTRVYIYIEF